MKRYHRPLAESLRTVQPASYAFGQTFYRPFPAGEKARIVKNWIRIRLLADMHHGSGNRAARRAGRTPIEGKSRYGGISPRADLGLI